MDIKTLWSPKNRSYLIRWKGYTTEEDTWLKESELGNAPELLLSYKKRLKPLNNMPPSIATITLSKQKKVAVWSLLVPPITYMETSLSHLHTMTKSSLEFLDHLTGYPETFDSLSFLFLYQTTNTTFSITLSGKHLKPLLFNHILVLTRNYLERNPSALALVATIAAQPTHPIITDIHNNVINLLLRCWSSPYQTHLYSWTISQTWYTIILTFAHPLLWITSAHFWKIILPQIYLYSTKSRNPNRLWPCWSWFPSSSYHCKTSKRTLT